MKKFKVVIAGGGSTFTPGIVKALLTKKGEFKLEELRVYDNDAERQRKVSVITNKVVQDMDPEVKFSQHTDPATAFADVDFVFAQIRVGKYAMREFDEKIPLSMGTIGQETCGPGGMAYALRTVGPMIEIVDYMEKYANENCWMMNYSNPASIVAEAMRILRPNSKVLNICDMPVGMMQKMTDIFKCEYEDIEPEYFGLNHFGWFTGLKVKGEERIDEMKAFIKEHGLFPETNYDLQHKDASWQKTYKNMKYMMNLFDDYVPNTYMQYYLLGDLILDQLNKDYTRANEVMDGRERELFAAVDHYERTGEYDSKAFHVGAHGLFIVDVAISMANDLRKKYLVIVENRGSIKNLPDDAMIEIPCFITSEGPVSAYHGVEIPTFYKGLIEQQLASEKCLVEAILENSYDKALKAFTLNKTVSSALKAKDILDAMIQA
ncbi:MAG: 6-phospho-alpha-glucosidase, partial [Fusobacteriaceae bacterium]